MGLPWHTERYTSSRMRAGRGESLFRVDSGSRWKMFGCALHSVLLTRLTALQARKAVAACAGKPDPARGSAVSGGFAATQEPLYRLAALFRAEKSLPPALTLLASASAGTAASAGASDSRSQQDDPLWRVTGCNVPSGPGKAPAPDAAATPTRLCGLGSGDISRCRRETR